MLLHSVLNPNATWNGSAAVWEHQETNVSGEKKAISTCDGEADVKSMSRLTKEFVKTVYLVNALIFGDDKQQSLCPKGDIKIVQCCTVPCWFRNSVALAWSISVSRHGPGSAANIPYSLQVAYFSSNAGSLLLRNQQKLSVVLYS